jgi:hypothetical protein
MEKGIHVLEWPWRASLLLFLQNIKKIPANTARISAPMLNPTITPTFFFELEFATAGAVPLRLPNELFIFMISNPFRIALG